jgi:hypothetical protein
MEPPEADAGRNIVRRRRATAGVHGITPIVVGLQGRIEWRRLRFALMNRVTIAV